MPRKKKAATNDTDTDDVVVTASDDTSYDIDAVEPTPGDTLDTAIDFTYEMGVPQIAGISGAEPDETDAEADADTHVRIEDYEEESTQTAATKKKLAAKETDDLDASSGEPQGEDWLSKYNYDSDEEETV